MNHYYKLGFEFTYTMLYHKRGETLHFFKSEFSLEPQERFRRKSYPKRGYTLIIDCFSQWIYWGCSRKESMGKTRFRRIFKKMGEIVIAWGYFINYQDVFRGLISWSLGLNLTMRVIMCQVKIREMQRQDKCREACWMLMRTMVWPEARRR